MLDRSDQFYEETKAAKDMADQVFVIDLPFGYMDVGNYPPPYFYQEIKKATDHFSFISPRP